MSRFGNVQVHILARCVQLCMVRKPFCAHRDQRLWYRAEYKRMLAHLREPGAALSVIPEGIAGIFLAQDSRVETIFLSKRKGFVRLAIQAGAGECGLALAGALSGVAKGTQDGALWCHEASHLEVMQEWYA